MSIRECALLAILLATLVLFIWSRWRQDLVAWFMLIIASIIGLVPAADVWSGLSHPAVVSVAAVLILSRALTSAGVVDWAAKPLEQVATRPRLLLAGLTAIAAAISGFINNVGALALLMPVAIRLAKTSGRPVSMYLMPLAFASLLGGMTTLIGTPPNLIVAGFRQQSGGSPFNMFDFAAVGLPVALAGITFLATVGWKLVPDRAARVSGVELFRIGPYLTEVEIPEKSPIVGTTVGEVMTKDLQLLSVVRGQRRFASPSPYLTVRAGDMLILLGSSEAITRFTNEKQLVSLKPQKKDEDFKGDGQQPPEDIGGLAESKEVSLAEAVVKPGSWIVGSSASTLRLRHRFGVNLLALAREGARFDSRLSTTPFRAGDVLLLQGPREDLAARIADLGCLPLAERPLGLGQSTRRFQALAVFAVAVALVAGGTLTAPVAFVGAAVAMVLLRILSLDQAYDAIDWPVLSLLAAMIPIGLAIETSGLAQRIAQAAVWAATLAPAWIMIASVLVITMFLSDLVNNAAAAVLMCPIALAVAKGLDVSAEPFLIATAIGASCAFLTPVGHQCNLLIMGPGGYEFKDYWRCGIVLELIIAVTSVPAIMLFWPLR